jgi:hypothetical protein
MKINNVAKRIQQLLFNLEIALAIKDYLFENLSISLQQLVPSKEPIFNQWAKNLRSDGVSVE